MSTRHTTSTGTRGWRRDTAVLALASLALAPLAALTTASPASAAPPANDAWEGATPVSGLPFQDEVDTTEATKDAVRPPGQYAENSVWYRVRLANSGQVLTSLRGTDYFPHVVRIYHAEKATDGPADWTLLGGDRGWNANNPAMLVRDLEAGERYYVMIGTNEETDGGTAKITLRRPARLTYSLAKYGDLDKVDGSALLRGTVRSTRPARVEISARLRQLVNDRVVTGSAERSVDVGTTSVPWRLRVFSGRSFKTGPARIVSNSLRLYDEGLLVNTYHFARNTVILR